MVASVDRQTALRAEAVPAEVTGTGLEIRDSHAGDARLLFDWRRDPVVIRHARHRSEPDWCTHVNWLQRRLQDRDCLLFIVELDGRPIGQVRFDIAGSRAVLSYSVAANHRGQGHARKSLALALQRLDVERPEVCTVRAEVRVDNAVSLGLLYRLRFVRGVGSPTTRESTAQRGLVTLERTFSEQREDLP